MGPWIGGSVIGAEPLLLCAGCFRQGLLSSRQRPKKQIYCLAILVTMGNMVVMKTTLDIQDELLARAKRHARKTGRSLRAVVEEGLQHVLLAAASRSRYQLPDLSVGNASDRDPIEDYSWQDLREMIYERKDAP